MKVSIFLLLLCVSNVFAYSSYSQNTQLTIHLKSGTIRQLFDEIQKQSEFIFFYKDDQIDLDKNISIDFEKSSIKEILDQVLTDTNLNYKIFDRQIVILPEKKEEALPKEKSPTLNEQPQKKQIRGKVTDVKGGPVPGVTVLVKGSNNGAITDVGGNFTLDVSQDAKALLFSFVGMKTQEISIGNLTSFNVVLEEENYLIDEFVTVAYGTKKKREVIGSISKVNGSELVNPAFGDFTQSLQGRATGVSVSNGQIRIRGIGSISNSSEPLFVVDGVITSNALNIISSNDIESIDIQKDASATSLYGSRASNGVVMITTKSGKGAKKSSFNVELNSGISQYPSEGYKLADGQETLAMLRLASLNTNKEVFDPSSPYWSWNSNMMPLMISDSLADATNSDWRKLTTRNRNLLNLVNYAGKLNDITISGNKVFDNANAYMSLNYRDEDGMQIGNSNKRIIGRLGFNFTPIKNINLSFASSITYRKNLKGASYGGPGFIAAYFPTYDNSSSGYWNPGFNPLAHGDKNLVDSYDQNFRSFGNIGLEILLPWVQGLSLKGNAGWDYSAYHSSLWTDPRMRGGVYSQIGAEKNTGQDTKSNSYNVLLNAMINYSRTFGIHKVDFMVGTEKQNSFSNETYLQGIDFPGLYHEIGQLTTASYIDAHAYDYGNEQIILAYFGRVSYSFNKKYMIEGSMRRDGFSKFSKDKRWGTFSSVGLGWMLSDEDFFKLSWLNTFKLRASIGQTGNSNLLIANPSVNVYQIRGDGNSYMNLPAEYLANIGNSKAGWETSNKKDVGFDYGLFENKINGSVAYFINDIDGLLLASPLPLSAGIIGGNQIWQNIGSMQNKGYEFSINATILKTNSFSWEASFNHTILSNKVTKLNPEAEAKGTGIIGGGNGYYPRTITKVGLPISTYFVPEWAGVDPEKGIPLCKPIDTELFDATGETVFTGGDPVYLSQANGVTHAYIQKGKSPMAKFYGGFFNTFKYKDFDLNLNFTYSGGNYVYDNNLNQQLVLQTGWHQIIAGRLANSWEKPGDVKAYPQITLNSKYNVDLNGDPSVTQTNAWLMEDSRMLIKGDYLKLKMITLGYNLPKLFAEKIGIEGLRIYGSITNLCTWSALKGDPEVTFGNNINGLNANFAPVVRTLSLGISAKF